MSISLNKALCLSGAAAVLYCVHNTISSSQYGAYLPIAGHGFATGAVAGLLLNNINYFPSNLSQFTMMSVTALASFELIKTAFNSHYSVVSGLTYLASAIIGCITTDQRNTILNQLS